jgi:hypothetical protein
LAGTEPIHAATGKIKQRKIQATMHFPAALLPMRPPQGNSKSQPGNAQLNRGKLPAHCPIHHATHQTRAATAQKRGMISMIVTPGVDHQGTPLQVTHLEPWR